MLLTKEQEKLFNDNIGLAKSVSRKYYPMCNSIVGEDDVLQQALVGLCIAAKTWGESNGEKGSFASFACVCMKHEIVKWVEYNRYMINMPKTKGIGKLVSTVKKLGLENKDASVVSEVLGVSNYTANMVLYKVNNQQSTSLNCKAKTNNENEGDELIDIKHSELDDIGCIALKVDIDHALSSMPDIYKNTFWMMAEGYTQADIAVIEGISRASVSCRCAKIQKKILNYVYKGSGVEKKVKPVSKVQELLDKLGKKEVLRILEANSINKACKMLGISRPTYYRTLKHMDLS